MLRKVGAPRFRFRTSGGPRAEPAGDVLAEHELHLRANTSANCGLISLARLREHRLVFKRVLFRNEGHRGVLAFMCENATAPAGSLIVSEEDVRDIRVIVGVIYEQGKGGTLCELSHGSYSSGFSC